MSGRWSINLLLLILLILLGVLIRAELDRARFVPRLTDLTAAELYRVEIARTGEPTLTLLQTAIGWRLETPFQVDADNERVAQLLGLLDAPVERSFPASSVDLRQLGLSPPRIRLRLDARELQFGLTDPVGQARYVASEGLVHLIQDRFQHRLIAPPIDYVSLQPVTRGFAPVFGRLDGVPLTPETLSDLERLHAERVEILVEAPGDATIELQSAEAEVLSFRLSSDRRRWARVDQRLLYVLTEAPELTADPTLTPPPMPEPLPAPDAAMFDSQAPASTAEPLPHMPLESGPVVPPVFRLTPDGEILPVEVPDADTVDSEFLLPGEPDKPAPSGFGQDPFAPDPAMYTDPPVD